MKIILIIWGVEAVLITVWALMRKKPKEPERPKPLCDTCEVLDRKEAGRYYCQRLRAGNDDEGCTLCKHYKEKPRPEPQYIIIPEDYSVSIGANLQRGLNTPANLGTLEKQKAGINAVQTITTG